MEADSGALNRPRYDASATVINASQFISITLVHQIVRYLRTSLLVNRKTQIPLKQFLFLVVVIMQMVSKVLSTLPALEAAEIFGQFISKCPAMQQILTFVTLLITIGW